MGNLGSAGQVPLPRSLTRPPSGAGHGNCICRLDGEGSTSLVTHWLLAAWQAAGQWPPRFLTGTQMAAASFYSLSSRDTLHLCCIRVRHYPRGRTDARRGEEAQDVRHRFTTTQQLRWETSVRRREWRGFHNLTRVIHYIVKPPNGDAQREL